MSISLRRNTMRSLLKERKDLQEQLAQLDAVITGLRKICRHKNEKGENALVFKENDNHRHYYECQVCYELIEEKKSGRGVSHN